VDIDIIYLNGYGFPAYRGGPIWYADTVGLKKSSSASAKFSNASALGGSPRPCGSASQIKEKPSPNSATGRAPRPDFR
jgi:3-hydroxyacyl-CoA dehydrogenase